MGAGLTLGFPRPPAPPVVLTSQPRRRTHHLQLHAFLGLAHGPLQSSKQLLGVLDLG